MHQGGFAAAGRADDRNEFAGLDIERHIIQRADLLAAEVVDLADVAEFDQSHRAEPAARLPELSVLRRWRGEGSRCGPAAPRFGRSSFAVATWPAGRVAPAVANLGDRRSFVICSSETISPSASPAATSA